MENGAELKSIVYFLFIEIIPDGLKKLSRRPYTLPGSRSTFARFHVRTFTRSVIDVGLSTFDL